MGHTLPRDSSTSNTAGIADPRGVCVVRDAKIVVNRPQRETLISIKCTVASAGRWTWWAGRG